MSITRISDIYDSNDVLILAHRGHRFGYVPENTMLAYDLAIALGADVIEVDVARTLDDRCVIVHGPLMETVSNLKGDVHGKYYNPDLKAVRYTSAYGLHPEMSIPTLEEVLENYKGRAVINIDRAYTIPELEFVYKIVERMDMLDYVLFKSPCCVDEVAIWLESHSYKAAYMPIVRNDETEMQRVLSVAKYISFPAVEITFRDDKMSIFSRETIAEAQKLGMKPLCNTIVLMGETLCGGHDDLVSILEGAEHGWGWLIDRGARILQTDCTSELKHYLNKRMEIMI